MQDHTGILKLQVIYGAVRNILHSEDGCHFYIKLYK